MKTGTRHSILTASRKRTGMLLFLLFGCILRLISAPETIIVGDIFDAQTHQPIENANIYFKNTQIGTTSNQEGLFMLRTDQKHSEILVVSAIGYKSQRFKVKIGQYAGVQVELTEENTLLQDVFILPGSNPALPLMEQVRAHRMQNNALMYEDYTALSSESFQLFVSNIDSRNLQRQMWKSLQKGIIVSEDSSLLLPLYLTRKNYLLNGNKKELYGTEREQNTVFSGSGTDTEWLQSSMEQNVDFYQNTISLFGRNFISPLASSGNAYYNFYLTDSLQTATGKQYVIRFKSKNIKNLAFQGEMHIDSASYALQHITATLPSKAAINFVADLQIRQDFSGKPPYPKTNEQATTLLDFAVSIDSIRHFPTLYAVRSTQTDGSQTAITTSVPDAEIVSAALDSLNNTRLMKMAKWTAKTLFTGYAPAGYIDIGKLVRILDYNAVEGWRIGLPLRTSEKLMKNICIEGYAGYGFHDKAWKYMGQAQFRLPGTKRHIIGLSYTNDYVRSEYNNFDLFLRENSIGRGYMDLASALLVFSPQYNMARQQEANLRFHDEWTDNFETRLDIRSGRQNYGTPVGTFYTAPTFRYNSIALTGRWSWDERTIDSFFTRRYLYNNLPVLHAAIEGGNFRIDETQTSGNYAKINLMLRQKISAGMFGTINYLIQAGYIFGSLPYPLLQTMHGNESWGYDSYKFSLMDNGEFVADKYVLLHADWNLGGILFNQIPGIKWLNLRELISLHAAYGGLRDSHATLLPLPEGTGTFSEPYVEIGAGIGNILRVLNVQSVWRLTERNRPGAMLWGVKFQLRLSM